MISQSYFPKQFPKIITKSYSPKLHFKTKITPKNYSPFKIALQSYRAKQLLKFAPIPQNCFPILFHKIIPEFSKAIPKSCSPKLLKLSPENDFPKLFLNLLPKVTVLQSNYLSILLQSRKITPHNYSPKLWFYKSTLQNGSPKIFCKIAPESSAPKLRPKTAPQSYYSSK